MSDDKTFLATCEPDSTQINADDLIGGPVTATIARVVVRTPSGKKGDQPVDVHLSGHDRPWRPCKTMRRLLIEVWGLPVAGWVGRLITLYRHDGIRSPDGGTTAGIRISAMSGIDAPRNISLTEMRGVKRIWTVRPIDVDPLAAAMTATRITETEVDAYLSRVGRPALSTLSPEQRTKLAAWLPGHVAEVRGEARDETTHA